MPYGLQCWKILTNKVKQIKNTCKQVEMKSKNIICSKCVTCSQIKDVKQIVKSGKITFNFCSYTCYHGWLNKPTPIYSLLK